jgi:CRP/FNR family cyclic AMP-dependent transcriptional regulator
MSTTTNRFSPEVRARATAYSGGGRAIAYRDIGPGEIFGELAAIDGASRSASIVAVEPTTVARLPEAAFRKLIDTHSGFHLGAAAASVGPHASHDRSHLRVQHTRCSGLPSISPFPTHFDLASMISTHREAVSASVSSARRMSSCANLWRVSRELSALTKIGLIEKRGERSCFATWSR